MDSIEEFNKKIEEAENKWANFTQNISKFSLDEVSNKFKNFTSQMNKSLSDLNASFSNSDKMSQSFNKIASGLGQIITLTTKFDAFKNLTVQGGHASSTMADQFDLLVDRFGSFEKAAGELAGKVSQPFAEALKAGEAATKAYLAHASSAEHLENAYLSLQGATGQLGKEFSDLAGLDKRLARFNTVLQDAAGQSNKTLKEVATYAMALGQIPGTLDQVVDTGRGFDEQLTGLTAALRLAAGSGKDVSEVISVMSTAYEKLGNPQGKVTDNTQKGAQLFALMSEASQKLNLRFDDTKGYLTHVAEQFQNIGDNTASATNILTRFSGALQNTGLTAKASVNIVQQMVDSIKGLEIGTKALISARTGGPGGLQGAFRIDNLLRQGKVDEVAKLMEQTLRQQFRGRIYTQEEAAQSPQAAAQFMRQRSLLRSGAFGSLAKDDETATRLLEALKTGSTSAAPMITAMSAVKETTGRGNEIQERQFTVLNKMNGGMDRLVSINEEQFKINARKAIGTAEENEYSQGLKNYRNVITQQATQETLQTEPLGFDEALSRQTKQGVGDFVDSVGVFKNVGSKAIQGIGETANAVGEIVSSVEEYMREEKEKRGVQTEIKRSEQAAQRGQQNLRTATHQVMRQGPTTLATQIPKAAEVMKHEVAVKPIEVNIKVQSDEGLKVQTATNKTENTTVKIINSTVSRGGISEVIR